MTWIFLKKWCSTFVICKTWITNIKNVNALILIWYFFKSLVVIQFSFGIEFSFSVMSWYWFYLISHLYYDITNVLAVNYHFNLIFFLYPLYTHPNQRKHFSKWWFHFMVIKVKLWSHPGLLLPLTSKTMSAPSSKSLSLLHPPSTTSKPISTHFTISTTTSVPSHNYFLPIIEIAS